MSSATELLFKPILLSGQWFFRHRIPAPITSAVVWTKSMARGRW